MCEPGTIVHRITCAIRRDRNHGITRLLPELGIPSVLIENGRTVRRRRYARFFRLLGYTERLDNSPVDLYQFSVVPAMSETVIQRLADALHLNRPGHGTVYVQECKTFLDIADEHVAPPADTRHRLPGLLQNLSVITCIMSMNGSGEELAKLALELGTGVPIVSLGLGTGLRDRLGLLRITVPAEKEVVRLLVPALDAEGLMRMLIEKGHLNRPGKGFIYCSPVLRGFLDTALWVGPQQHAATMGQVVAAIDELEKSTAWRRRFPELNPDARFQLQLKRDDVTMTCQEEVAGQYVEAAIQAGAGAATNAHLQRVTFDNTAGGARERYTFVVPRSITGQVLDALRRTCDKTDAPLDCLEVHPVDFSFSYRTESSRLFH